MVWLERVIDFVAATKPLLEKARFLVSTVTAHDSKSEGKIIQFPTKQRSPRKPDGSGPFSPAA